MKIENKGMIGIIDEVKIYDRALTLAEIQRDYTLGVVIPRFVVKNMQ